MGAQGWTNTERICSCKGRIYEYEGKYKCFRCSNFYSLDSNAKLKLDEEETEREYGPELSE